MSLDTIGIAAFSHDFGALQGKRGDVEVAFDALGEVPPIGLDILFALLGPILPFVSKIPTKRHRMLSKLHRSMREIAESLLQQTRKDIDSDVVSHTSRSIMGALSEA